jgi:hypothetical protein
MRPRPSLLVFALAVPLLLGGCRTLDRALLGVRSVAGGIHNKRKAAGIAPFFLPDGRLGCAANGALLLEPEPGAELVQVLPTHANLDDPAAAPDGGAVVFVSGKDQVTAGGGHNDHVWQVYSVTLEDGLVPRDWTRVTRSERAEVLPRYLPGGDALVLVRRPDYEPYALEGSPWGDGAVFVREAGSGVERQVTAPRFHPVDELVVTADGERCILGAPDADGVPCVFEVDLAGDVEPRVVLVDARLPALTADGGRLLFARETDAGWSVLVHDAATGNEDVLVAGRAPLLSLAVAPDGTRAAFAEHLATGGTHGTFVLWTIALDAPEPRDVLRIKGRSPEVTKLWDAVQPTGWYGDDAASPGSR